MDGKVGLIWGFSKLQAPTGCDNFSAYAIASNGKVGGCALAWDWPNGDRYLSGLRFSRDLPSRPRPAFWKKAFECLLGEAAFAWTSIGQENVRARRILESGAKGLPHYEARQQIITWFVPLGAKQAKETSSDGLDRELGLEAANWRHVAIASGEGWAYRTGRLLHRWSLPGIPPPGRPIRIGYYHPSSAHTVRAMRAVWREARGYDGIVVVLPESDDRARRWADAAPRLSWKWRSTLYSVSWTRVSPEASEWKGLWL